MEKKNRVHLLRMSCVGKLFSDHVMPISLNTLCKAIKGRGTKPRLENYGDVSLFYCILNFIKKNLGWSFGTSRRNWKLDFTYAKRIWGFS